MASKTEKLDVNPAKSSDNGNVRNGLTSTESVKLEFDAKKYPELEDSFCTSKDPKTVKFREISLASILIKDGVELTPCPKSKLSSQLGMTVYLKKEFLQYTGSFKERGARYALLMLSDEQKKRGVIAASLGNHSQGLSYHAKLLNIPCTVVMPKAAPFNKVQKCRKYGANVIVQGKDISESRNIAMVIAKDKDLSYINGYDHPHIIAGQGTVGLEICDQIKDADAIVVPVGGGGLLAGVAVAAKTLKPNIKIIGVESHKCQSFSNAMQNGSPIHTTVQPTLADGLAVPVVGYNAFATAVPLLDKMIVIKEEWIALAILELVEAEKCVVEGAGASGLAAILAGHLNEFRNKKVVVILCGGNIDTNILGRCLERGLVAKGQLLMFNISVSDTPGALLDLCALATSSGVSVIDIAQERRFRRDIYNVELKVVCETRSWTHSEEFVKILQENYIHFLIIGYVVINNVFLFFPSFRFTNSKLHQGTNV